jgi:hypothetical protein
MILFPTNVDHTIPKNTKKLIKYKMLNKIYLRKICSNFINIQMRNNFFIHTKTLKTVIENKKHFF